MAAVNGQFDLALVLLQRGANPNLASVAGTTPLFATLERTWAPRSSYAHPIEHQQQKATYLELLEALLKAGADPNVRLTKHLWYMEYTFGVLRARDRLHGATPFWRAAYALDVDAMRLLKAYGADPIFPRSRRPRGAPGGDDSGSRKLLRTFEVLTSTWAIRGSVGGPTSIRYTPPRSRLRTVLCRKRPSVRSRNWVPAVKFLVEECGAEVDIRDANGYTALHHAASRGDNELVVYLVEKGADVKARSRKGQTTADMANGPIERVAPFPETIALLVKLGAKNNNNCVSC
jgi:ankyrin repeat protein